jgi:hypothetical protein
MEYSVWKSHRFQFSIIPSTINLSNSLLSQIICYLFGNIAFEILPNFLKILIKLFLIINFIKVFWDGVSELHRQTTVNLEAKKDSSRVIYVWKISF